MMKDIKDKLVKSICFIAEMISAILLGVISVIFLNISGAFLLNMVPPFYTLIYGTESINEFVIDSESMMDISQPLLMQAPQPLGFSSGSSSGSSSSSSASFHSSDHEYEFNDIAAHVPPPRHHYEEAKGRSLDNQDWVESLIRDWEQRFQDGDPEAESMLPLCRRALELELEVFRTCEQIILAYRSNDSTGVRGQNPVATGPMFWHLEDEFEIQRAEADGALDEVL